MKHSLIPALLVLGALLLPRTVQAEADARDYEGLSSAPNGTVVVWNYLRHETASSGSGTTINSSTYRATYVLRFGELALIPFDATIGAADATAQVPLSPMSPVPTGNIQQTALTDLQYFPTLGYNHVENKEDNTHTYFGTTMFLTLPTGTYNSSNPFNINMHRIEFKPQVMVGQRFAKIFTAALIGNLQIYGNNSSFGVPTAPQLGNQTLKQAMSYNMELHLAADVDKTMFLGASFYLYSTGAQTFDVGGMQQTVEKQGTKETLRFTWGIHIEKQTLLMLQINQDVHASGGLSKSRWVGGRISHFFW